MPLTTLIEAVQTTVRRLHYSPRTEEAYLHWIRVFITFHEGRHPRKLGGPEITAFLNHLAVERHTAASTQNQALCAVLFLISPRPQSPHARTARPRARPPSGAPSRVLSRREVIALPDLLEPPATSFVECPAALRPPPYPFVGRAARPRPQPRLFVERPATLRPPPHPFVERPARPRPQPRSFVERPAALRPPPRSVSIRSDSAQETSPKRFLDPPSPKR